MRILLEHTPRSVVLETIAWLLLVFLLGGCSDQGAPLPEGSTRFTPPDIYERWWQEVEECSGRSANFRSVTWYYVGGDTTWDFECTTAEHPSAPQDVCGVAIPAEGIVILAKGRIDDDYVVRHEMLHIIAGTPGHPPEVFGPTAPCYNIVARGGL